MEGVYELQEISAKMTKLIELLERMMTKEEYEKALENSVKTSSDIEKRRGRKPKK